MRRLYAPVPDFEATIRILTAEEGGRTTAPFNGIRWDFAYREDQAADSLYMIWPDFYGPSGDSLPTDAPLPIGVEIPARMTVVAHETRDSIHGARVRPGVEFYCHEGRQRVAVGRVTRVVGLRGASQ